VKVSGNVIVVVWWGWRERRESEEVEVLWYGRCMIKLNATSKSNP